MFFFCDFLLFNTRSCKKKQSDQEFLWRPHHWSIIGILFGILCTKQPGKIREDAVIIPAEIVWEAIILLQYLQTFCSNAKKPSYHKHAWIIMKT